MSLSKVISPQTTQLQREKTYNQIQINNQISIFNVKSEPQRQSTVKKEKKKRFLKKLKEDNPQVQRTAFFNCGP